MKLVALSLLIAFTANAADGGWDVEFLDAGTTLAQPMVCVAPNDAVSLDIELRSAESERDTYKTATAWSIAAGVVMTVAAGVAAAYAVIKK